MNRCVSTLLVLSIAAPGCARQAPDSTAAVTTRGGTAATPAAAPPAASIARAAAEATVFTDSGLFALHCTQADTGLSPTVGRCTLRDQGVKLIRPAPSAPARPLPLR